MTIVSLNGCVGKAGSKPATFEVGPKTSDSSCWFGALGDLRVCLKQGNDMDVTLSLWLIPGPVALDQRLEAIRECLTRNFFSPQKTPSEQAVKKIQVSKYAFRSQFN